MMPFTINDLQLHNQNILGLEAAITVGWLLFTECLTALVIFKPSDLGSLLNFTRLALVSWALTSALDPECCHLRVILTRQLLWLMRLLTLTENSQAVSQSEAGLLSDDQSEARRDLEPWRPSVSSEDERFMGP